MPSTAPGAESSKVPDRVVIIGAGHAGANAAAALRQFNYGGEIVLLSNETHLPYHRPPLSKSCLNEERPPEALALRPTDFYREQDIELRLGVEVVSLELGAQRVHLRGSEPLTYRYLILATGSQARSLALPGAEPEGFHSLRTLADATRLKAALHECKKVAIIGGGYIGLEVAASVIGQGKQVVVLEREERVLQRVASPSLSEFFAGYHTHQGVDIITSAEVAGLRTTGNGRLRQLILADRRQLDADLAVVGIGAIPCDRLAREAGLACEGGVLVDAAARTSDPAVFAIGDVASRPLSLYAWVAGGVPRARLESVSSAQEMARQAAAAITGSREPKPEAPWFWSDQYDIKLQITGIARFGQQQILRGVPGQPGFAVFHLAEGRLVCVEAINAPEAFVMGKLQLAGNAPSCPDVAKLADTSVPLPEAFRSERA